MTFTIPTETMNRLGLEWLCALCRHPAREHLRGDGKCGHREPARVSMVIHMFVLGPPPVVPGNPPIVFCTCPGPLTLSDDLEPTSI